MKLLINILILAALFLSCTNRPKVEETVIELKDPCDTVIIKKDTTVNVTDTLYVNPGDTLGTDSLFHND